MGTENREGELVLPPGLFGETAVAAAWRAVAVFLLAYVIPQLVLGRSSWGSGLQWVGLLLTYFLVVLTIFRMLEGRQEAPEEARGALVRDASGPVTVQGALDEIVDPQSGARRLHKPKDWSVELLQQLDWQRMLAVCLAYFSDRFEAQAGKLAEDGCVEIRLAKDGSERPVGVVRCRAWGDEELLLAALENMTLQMAQELIGKGFCMGYGAYADDVRAFAKEHGITLIDNAMFISMLNRLPDERKAALLALAVDGDFAVPSCPECGLKMIIRQHDQARYWGCRAYPRCKGVLPMRGRAARAAASPQPLA